MPMIGVYAADGTFDDKHKPTQDQDLQRGVEALQRSGPGHATFAGR
jgi:hypothetical protein